jgi:hypothetical protein
MVATPDPADLMGGTPDTADLKVGSTDPADLTVGTTIVGAVVRATVAACLSFVVPTFRSAVFGLTTPRR